LTGVLMEDTVSDTSRHKMADCNNTWLRDGNEFASKNLFSDQLLLTFFSCCLAAWSIGLLNQKYSTA
jgi:hypothetical protein